MNEIEEWVTEKLVETKEYWENPFVGPAFIGGIWVVFVALAMVASSVMAWQTGYSSAASNVAMLVVGLLFLPYFVFSAYRAVKEYEQTKDQAGPVVSLKDNKEMWPYT